VNSETTKIYDQEERTFRFAKEIREFVKILPVNSSNIEDSKQLIRASASVGANYIEANESLSKKDFAFRIKICRKESKESGFFLRLLDIGNIVKLEDERKRLFQESVELMKIFGSILQKTVPV
jgi:four helix bundle protein